MSHGSFRITQGYIAKDGGNTVRVRLREGRGFITIKGPADATGIGRFEWEKEIPAEEAALLLKLSPRGVIDKTRYLVEHGGHTFEVDEFYGDNAGLTVAEVELSSAEEDFQKPSWLGREVSLDPRFFNSHLLVHPFKDWKDREEIISESGL